MVTEDNYIDIQGWMVADLGLRGKELMAYAIIYGFSQDGAGWFYGGRKYVADWLGCNEKTAGSLLTSMTENGLLIRKEAVTSNGKTYRYQAVRHRAENAPTSGDTEPTTGEKRPNLGAKNAHITTMDDYKQDNKERVGRFTPPTREEVAEYAREKGYTSFPVDRFIAYYESNGWMVGRNKMKSWKASMTNWWCRDHQDEPKGTPMPQSFRDKIEQENQRMYRILGYEKGLKKEGA